jgi:segregation and condensation protein B
MCQKLQNIVETIIFASEKPVSHKQLFSLIERESREDIKKAVEALMSDYEQRNGGIHLCNIAGGLQFRTKPEYKTWLTLLKKKEQNRLTRATLETLSIIAYKQPVIRSDIDYIRGVDSGVYIRTLLDMKLIKILGKKDLPGRPLIYATTAHFLEMFELSSLKELPDLKEFVDKN